MGSLVQVFICSVVQGFAGNNYFAKKIFMTPCSLFNIILKIIGLFFVKDLFVSVPQVISSLIYFESDFSSWANFSLLLVSVTTLAVYVLIMYLLLIHTNWVIDKFGLDKNFQEEKFEFNLHRSTVMSIAILIVGVWMFFDELPRFCSYGFRYLQMKKFENTFLGEAPSAQYLVLSISKLIVAFLLVKNHAVIVSWMERTRKKSKLAGMNDDSEKRE